jgi:putative CocE/NonD family hydrolase
VSRLAKSLYFFLVLAMLPSWAAAQDFEFHPPASPSDPAAPAVMRDLAERMLPVYQEDNPERYLANLSALQLVAGNYTAAYASRQSLRDRRRSEDSGRPIARTAILDMYAHARAIEAANRVPFAQAFGQAFRDVVQRLNDPDAYAVAGWLGTPVPVFQEPLQKAFDRLRPKGTISLADAVDLMQAYVAFDAYRSFSPLVGALNAEDDRRRYETQEDVLIKTPDGASLAALVVRPKSSSKPLPALLEYTIYVTQNYAREVAAHGYVGVVAYARGRGKSSGRFVPYQHDGDDARTVINWIARQPWSDGRVGMYGGSYSGFAQWAAAKHLPPALQAIATSAGGIAPGIDVPNEGGIFRNYAYRWSLYVTDAVDEKTYSDDAQWRSLDQAWYASGKRYRDFGRLYGKPDPLFLRWLNHPSYDRFWQKMVPYREQFARIDIPVLATTGYYAGGEAGALYYFNQAHRHDPHADHTLVIGPYDDGLMQRAAAPVLRGLQVDPAAAVDLRELRYQWFDHVLKGGPQPSLLQDRVNYEVMGANEWRHAPSLEAMANGSQKFYLDAAPVGAGHRLAQRKGSEATFVGQTVNLADRSDGNWTPPSDIVGESISTRYGMTFVSEPLTKPLELNGLLTGRLDFTVNKMDLDLNVALYELLPTGEYLQLFEPYAFRASYARDRVHRHLLKAGERQLLPFKSERLTSRRLQIGSRLVMVLGVNKRPDQEINYGTGDDVSVESIEDGTIPVKIRWYSGSYIEIPVRL